MSRSPAFQSECVAYPSDDRSRAGAIQSARPRGFDSILGRVLLRRGPECLPRLHVSAGHSRQAIPSADQSVPFAVPLNLHVSAPSFVVSQP